MRAGAVDQEASHHLTRDAEKLPAVLPHDPPLINQSEVHLVNERRRLPRMAPALPAQLSAARSRSSRYTTTMSWSRAASSPAVQAWSSAVTSWLDAVTGLGRLHPAPAAARRQGDEQSFPPLSRQPGGGHSPADHGLRKGRRAMWRHRILACALLTGMLPGVARAQTPVLIGFLDGDTRAYVRRAFEGAAARLGRSECQTLLSDYPMYLDNALPRRSRRAGAVPSKPSLAYGSSRIGTRRSASGAPRWRSRRSALRSFASVDATLEIGFSRVGGPLSSS